MRLEDLTVEAGIEDFYPFSGEKEFST